MQCHQKEKSMNKKIIALCMASCCAQNYPMDKPLSVDDFELVSPRRNCFEFLKNITTRPRKHWENEELPALKNPHSESMVKLCLQTYSQMSENHRNLIELLVKLYENNQTITPDACEELQKKITPFISKKLTEFEAMLTMYNAIINASRKLANLEVQEKYDECANWHAIVDKIKQQ